MGGVTLLGVYTLKFNALRVVMDADVLTEKKAKGGVLELLSKAVNVLNKIYAFVFQIPIACSQASLEAVPIVISSFSLLNIS